MGFILENGSRPHCSKHHAVNGSVFTSRVLPALALQIIADHPVPMLEQL